MNRIRIKSKVLVVLSFLFLLLSASWSFADTFPSRSIDVVVCWPPGGGADRATRTICKYAEKELGQKINIINIQGGGGAIGYNRVARAKPDGYTLINIQSELVALEAQKTAPISRSDFIPIISMATQYAPIITRSDSPFKTFEEFVAKCKESPDKYNVGGSPLKSIFHQAAVLLMEEAGIKFNYVPTGGSPKTMAALLGGHIDTGFMWLSVADSYIRSGELIGLVVLAPERLRDYPQVPTLKEKGIDITFSGYYGIGVPKGTPPDIVKVLEDKFTKAFNNPECQKEYTKKLKLDLMYLDSDGFKKFLDKMYKTISKALDIMEKNK